MSSPEVFEAPLQLEQQMRSPTMATSNNFACKANAMKMVDGWFRFSLLRLEVISSSMQPREAGM